MSGPWEKFKPAQSEAAGPWSKFKKTEAPAPKKEGGSAEAALQGFGQAASFGYLPNLQAAAQKVTDPLFELATGSKVEREPYIEARDEAIKRDLAIQEKSPGSYLAGQVGGALSAPVPGAGLLKGAGAVTKAATSGAIQGALYNPGEEEGKMSPLQLKERGINTLSGGALGGGLAKGGSILAKQGGKMASASKALAAKALGAQKGQFEKLLDRNRLEPLADFAKEEGLIGIGKNVEDSFQKSSQIIEEVGPKLKNLYKDVENKIYDPKFIDSLNPSQLKKLEQTDLVPSQIAKEIMGDIESKWSKQASGKQVISRVQSELEQLQNYGEMMDVTDLHAYRKSLDELINFDRSVGDMPAVQKGLKTVRDKLNERIDKRISALDEVVGGSQAKQLKDLNRRYSLASDANAISKKAFSGEETKMAFGLPEQLVGGAVGLGATAQDAMSGNLSGEDLAENFVKGAAAGALFKGARRYGPGLLSSGLSKGGAAQTGLGKGLMSPQAVQGLRIFNEPKFKKKEK